MQIQRSLPPIVLLIAAIAITASLFLSSNDRAWLFTTSKGAPLAEEQVYWWAVLLPLGIGAAAIGSICLSLVARQFRAGRWHDALASMSVGTLGVLALFAAVTWGYRWSMLQRQPAPPPQPRSRHDAFLPEQWSDLAYQPVSERRLGPLLPGGIGLRDHPGFIPCDPFLLRRLTFVGLRPEQVWAVLGPPLPVDGQFKYFMPDCPGQMAADLYFATDSDARAVTVVTHERLSLQRPNY